jgi:hypothetical protein
MENIIYYIYNKLSKNIYKKVTSEKDGVVGETLVSLQREGASEGTVGSLEKGS